VDEGKKKVDRISKGTRSRRRGSRKQKR